MAEQLARHKIQGLVVIGGFEAFHAVLQLHEQREKFKQFRIPMVITKIILIAITHHFNQHSVNI